MTEADLDACLARLLRARFRLGMFDALDRVPYARIPFDVIDCDEHRRLAREAAGAGLVLLENDGLLPLRTDIASVAVIGPNAHAPLVLWANYSGTASRTVTPLDGIRAALEPAVKVYYAEGCKAQGTDLTSCAPSGNLTEAVLLAKRADVTVLVLGLNAQIEGEQGDAGNSEAAGDKLDLELPGLQQQLLDAVLAVGKPVVLVLISGSALAARFAGPRASAILQAFYPGEEGGRAIADVLFGKTSPAGRLPVTFPRSLADVPPFEDYAMRRRTYRFAEVDALYPFGFGLSYTRFEYSALTLSPAEVDASAELEVSVQVRNAGSVASDEVVQLYVRDLAASVAVACHELRGVERIHLRPGESQRVSFRVDAKALSLIDESGGRRLEPGAFRIFVGGSQPDARSEQLLGQAPLSAELRVSGAAVSLPY